MESSHSFVIKDDDISAKEVLEDQVENIDVGDAKVKPEGLNLLARISFNFLNIRALSFIFQGFLKMFSPHINCNQPSQGYVCQYMSDKVMFRE